MRKWFGGWSPSRRTGQITAALLLGTTVTVLILASVYHLGVPATIVAVVVGLPGLWLAWVPYRDQRKTARETNLRELSDQLAMAVTRQWEAEARIRRLNDPYPLPVSWSAADPELTDDWAVIEALGSTGAGKPVAADRDTWANGPAELASQGDGLAAVLAQVPTRRLVVLGEPGAGKTMLMVRLVLDLLASRQAGMPVPFLVPLASWNPLSQGLDEWLAARLTVNHSALTAAAGDSTQAQALLEAGLILPLLDGLDEIPEVIRGPAIAQINEALRPGDAIIVTCRIEDYQRTVQPTDSPEVMLRAAAAIQLNPLSPSVVSSYLLTDAGGPRARERWAPVTATLGSTAPVAQALTTPLMVSLARIIYNPRPGESAGQLREPAELCGEDLPDREAVEAHLLDAFVPAAYRDRKNDLQAIQWTERWLKFLAAYLDFGIGGTDIAWWQIRQITPAAIRIDLRKAAYRPVHIPLPARRLDIDWDAVRNSIPGLYVGGLIGLVVGANTRVPGKPATAWSPSTIPDIIFGALIGLAVFTAAKALKAVPGNIETAVSPRGILRRDLRAFWVLFLWIALSTVLIAGFGSELIFSVRVSAEIWILGIIVGSIVGFAASSPQAAWYPYISARIWLARRHQLPWALMRFLEDSHERGVLRQAGAVYQFRHIELQHRLAERYEAPAWFQQKAKSAFLSAVVIALAAETPAVRRGSGLKQVIEAAQARRTADTSRETLDADGSDIKESTAPRRHQPQ
jgi:hypothetical protein